MEKKTIETVALIHIKDKKLLLVRPYNKKIFYMPGGKRDQGEGNLEALVREIKEELMLEIDPKTADFYGVFKAQAYGKDDGVMVKIHCYTTVHKGNVESSTEIEELAFFSHDEYLSRKEVAPAVRLIIKDLKAKGLIE